MKQALSPSTKTQTEVALNGECKYNDNAWYSSELTLQDNGTFKFHDQGCYGQRFSKGEWTDSNGVIQLSSFENFRQTEQTKTSKSNEVVKLKKPKRTLRKGEVEYSYAGFKDVPPPFLPGPNDTILVYLDKIQLQVRNDTLYNVGSNKLPEGALFLKKQNNRH